jgi:hypothetical protein
MKKVLAVALICAVSSFAAWDKFPVIGDGKGEAMVSFSSTRQANDGDFDNAGLGIRYSPLENLELTASQLVFGDYTLGARYQIIPVLAFGVDVGFPMPGTAWTFSPSLQFSMEMGSIALGTNVGVNIFTEDANKYAQGLTLDAGLEIDCNIGKSTLWVGFDIATGLSNSKIDGTELKEDAQKAAEADQTGNYRGLELKPSVGYIANVSENFAVGTWAEFGIGASGDKDKDNKLGYGEHFKTTVGVDANVKF